MRPRHVTTSAFYSYVFEDVPFGNFELVPNQRREHDDRRTRKYSTTWAGLPVPAGSGLVLGQRVWIGYASLHDTRQIFVLADDNGPIWPEPPEPRAWLPEVFVWHSGFLVGRRSGGDKTEPPLFVLGVPRHFYAAGRWQEREGRDESQPPSWRVYRDPATGILRYDNVAYMLHASMEPDLDFPIW
jgi:hypothetical protein